MSASDKAPAEPDIVVPANGLASMRPLDLVVVLRNALEDRDVHADTWTDADTQHFSDRTTFALLESLREHAADRWLALCREAQPAPILLAGLTYCRDFTWSNFVDLATKWQLDAEPFSTAMIALGFADSLDPGAIPLSRLLQRAPDPGAACLLLASIDRLPILDVDAARLAASHAALAGHIAWLCARDGYPAGYSRGLLDWHRAAAGTPLSFWTAFALVLREPTFHERHGQLMNWAGEDAFRQAVAGALSQAIAVGPLALDAYRSARAQLHQLPRIRRLTNALRLAAYGPTGAPLIDPYSSSRAQKRQESSLVEHFAVRAEYLGR